MSPDFIIRVASNYNGGGQLLQWETRPDLKPIGRDPIWRDMRLYGRFACYRLPARAKPMELEPETMVVSVPIETMAKIALVLAGLPVPRGLKTEVAHLMAAAR